MILPLAKKTLGFMFNQKEKTRIFVKMIQYFKSGQIIHHCCAKIVFKMT